LFDRATVFVYANVTAATHGKTVNNEILGTSAGISTNQHFALKQLPLTYVSAPNDIGLVSTLKVEVNGIRWDEVPHLYQNDLGRRVFAVQRDPQGGSSVVFGDSQDGAGVPSGTQQISATYRIGSGEIGNVAANSLTQLQTAIPGIKSVTNPIPAVGGADPERAERAQSLARLHLRSLQRIVSLTDFEDFGRVFPGIGKAKIASLTRSSRPVLVLTVAGEDGTAVPLESDLYQNLTAAYAANRALPLPVLIIDSFEPIYFNVEATLLIDAHYWDSRDLILSDAAQVLLSTFSFDSRDFVQPIAASEVIVALHSVTPGIVAVENLKLYRVDMNAAFNNILVVKGTRSERGILLPAQMLLINPIPTEGIRLHLEIVL
jgi:predicted phage baseplate assembly protein